MFFRLFPLLLSALLVVALYWVLNLPGVRLFYEAWDKWVHASVFFVIWWLGRWSLRISCLWISLLVVLGGGMEEIHQMFQPGHVASLDDWLADVAGVSVAVLIYVGARRWSMRFPLRFGG